MSFGIAGTVSRLKTLTSGEGAGPKPKKISIVGQERWISGSVDSIVGVIRFQKIFRLYGLKGYIVEKR